MGAFLWLLCIVFALGYMLFVWPGWMIVIPFFVLQCAFFWLLSLIGWDF